MRDSGRRAPEKEHLSLQEMLGEPGGVKKALEMGTSFHGGLTGKPGKGLICRGFMYGRSFWDGCLSIQGPHWEAWGGGSEYQEL